MGRKHCGKRRNCSLRAISPFPSVFNRLVSQGCQKVSLCGNGLIQFVSNTGITVLGIGHQLVIYEYALHVLLWA